MYNEDELDLSGIDMIEKRNFEREFCQEDNGKLSRKDKIIVALLLLAMLVLLIINHIYGFLDERKNVSTVKAADAPIYVICDADYDKNGDFVVTLPNGDVCEIDNDLSDTPDTIREVVIESTNLDDSDSYEVVGLR